MARLDEIGSEMGSDHLKAVRDELERDRREKEVLASMRELHSALSACTEFSRTGQALWGDDAFTKATDFERSGFSNPRHESWATVNHDYCREWVELWVPAAQWIALADMAEDVSLLEPAGAMMIAMHDLFCALLGGEDRIGVESRLAELRAACESIPVSAAEERPVLTVSGRRFELREYFSWLRGQITSRGNAVASQEDPVCEDTSMEECDETYSVDCEPEGKDETGLKEGIFARTGDGWNISFARMDATVLDVKGMSYIRMLLEHPRLSIPVSCLEKGILEAQPGKPLDVVLDQHSGAVLRARLTDLEEARKEVQDAGELETNEEEEHEIRKQLSNSYTPAGRPRLLDPTEDSSRHRVGSAIATALSRIRQVHPPLHGHLVDSLKTPRGATPRYEPTEQVTWILS